jgi:hypothetical protein
VYPADMSIGITTVQNIQLAYRQDSTLNNCSNHEYKILGRRNRNDES